MLHNYKGGEVWGQDIANRNYWPMLYAPFGPYTFKLNLCTTAYYHDFEINGPSCRPDTSITTYTYGKGIAQLPVHTKYGYKRKGEDDFYKYQALYAYKLTFNFETDGGCMNYLNGKSFQVSNESIWFLR